MKRVLIGIAAGAGLLLAAALAVPALMDWSGYRDRIAGQIEAVTGRDASVGGDIGFALLPRPAFSTGAVRIASVSGAASPDLVAAPAATLDVAFFPLLQGKLRVTRVLLQEPRISLEVTPGGRRNWVFAEADKARRQGRAKGTRLAIRALSARDATVSYRERGRRPVTVSHLDFDVRAESARGPFYARGRTVLRDVPLRFALQVDRLDPQPVSFDLMVKADGHTSLHYRGRGAAKTGVEGRLALGSRDAGVLARLAGLSQEGALAGRKVSIDGDLAVAPERVDARRIDLSLGDISASGEASLSLKGRPALSVRLKAGRLDLDPLIENWPKPEPPAGGQTADGVSPGREEGPGLDLAVDLAADTVVLRKQPIRQVRLRASLDGGRLSVPSLAAVLPGETQVHFTGDADDETPTTLSGRLSVASAHPRALLAWAGLDPGPVPEGRFARLSIDSQVSGDASLIKFDRIALTLDDTAVDGWFQVRPGGAIDGDLRADRLDLDAYRAPDGAPGRPFDWKRLAFLGRLQGELRLAVERLTVGGLRFSGATADLAFADGVMSVRRAGAEGRDGGIVALSGTVREFGRIPLWDLEGHIKAARLGDLVEPAGAGAAPALFDSPVTLEAASRGNAGTATLSAKGVVGPTRVSLDGDSKSWGTADRELALRVEASSDSWDAVARQLGLEHRRPLDGRDSPVTLKGTLAAKGDKVDVDATAELAGGKLVLSGPLTLGDAGRRYDLALTAQGPDASRFLRAVGVPFEPSPDGDSVGGFLIKTAIEGPSDRLALSGIRVELGAAKLTGHLLWDTTGKRPRFEAAFQGNGIDADRFFPRRTTGPEFAREPGGQRWSREPFDVDWLRGVDGTLTLTADQLIFRRYALDKPLLRAGLDGGRLRLDSLTGMLFGGPVRIAGTADLRRTPSVSLDIDLKDASVEDALEAVADLNFATGTFALSGKFSGSGKSEYDLMSHMDGQASVRAQGGVVRGLDMPRLSDQLSNLRRYDDFLDLADAALSGGETRYGAAGGTLNVRDGIVSSDDLHAELDDAEGRASGTVDLPDWTVDAQLALRLTAAEHAKTPGVGMLLYGPIDHPERKKQVGALAKFVGKKLAGTVIRDVFGDGRTGRALQEMIGEEGGPDAEEDAPDREHRHGHAKRVLNKLLEKLDEK